QHERGKSILFLVCEQSSGGPGEQKDSPKLTFLERQHERLECESSQCADKQSQRCERPAQSQANPQGEKVEKIGQYAPNHERHRIGQLAEWKKECRNNRRATEMKSAPESARMSYLVPFTAGRNDA